MSFFIKDDEVWEKYDKILDMIKDELGVKFHSKPVYEYKNVKTKEREFDGVMKTNFLGNGVPKGNTHYTCIACITINSVVKIGKKNYLQVYLEECKYRVKKTQMSRFINIELKSDSESSDLKLDSEESKFDNKLRTKLESGPDSE